MDINEEKKHYDGENYQVVTFLMNREVYGLDIFQVKEIITIDSVEPIPDTPDFIEGVYSLRGEIIPILDLRKRFELQNKTKEKVQNVIITQYQGLKTGFIVDDILQVKIIKRSDIQPPPPIMDSVGEKYIYGVYKEEKEFTILLSLEQILSFDLAESLYSGAST